MLNKIKLSNDTSILGRELLDRTLYILQYDIFKGLDKLGRFSIFFYKGDNFCDFLLDFLPLFIREIMTSYLLSSYQPPSETASTLKRNNLLPRVH